MTSLSFFSVFGGAGLGAVLRWWLGSWLNPVFPTIPLGTVAANFLGGLLIGFFSAYFSHRSGLPPELRLLIITGFLGGLTTFSAFSAEVFTLIARQEYAWAMGAAGLHLGGSLLLTGVGVFLAQWLVIRS